MTPLNNNKRLDNPKNIVENDGPNETMNVKKTPWFLRWPGAILRKLGMLASKALSLGSAILQPIRQRLNHWNWRKKTALVTALGNHRYRHLRLSIPRQRRLADRHPHLLVHRLPRQRRCQLRQLSRVQKENHKKANENPDGWLYSNREYCERDYDVDESGTTTENYRVAANALYHQAYDTSGIDSRERPSELERRQVIDYVKHNANLNGHENLRSPRATIGRRMGNCPLMEQLPV